MAKFEFFFNKKFLIGLVCTLFIMLVAFLAMEKYTDMKVNSRIYSADVLDAIDQRMTSLFFELNNFPRSAGNDILFLSRLSSLQYLLNSDNTNFKKQKEKDLGGDFLRFIKENTAYYQLRYIDETGYEIIRVDFDSSGYKIISGGKLQDKSWRYYFDQVMKLDEYEVYISSLDLNVEYGKLENRGNSLSPIYVPVIRYGTPIFDYEGKRKGVVISNIYADYFLEDIRRFQRKGEKVFLIDEEGYYLAHPDMSKEFAFMFSGDANFYRDYSDISREDLADFNKRKTETENFIFSFRHIYPTIGSFELYKGSKKVLGENPDSNYYWTLVSISEKNEVQKISENIKRNFFFSLVFSTVIISIIVVLVFVLIRVEEKKHN